MTAPGHGLLRCPNNRCPVCQLACSQHDARACQAQITAQGINVVPAPIMPFSPSGARH